MTNLSQSDICWVRPKSTWNTFTGAHYFRFFVGQTSAVNSSTRKIKPILQYSLWLALQSNPLLTKLMFSECKSNCKIQWHAMKIYYLLLLSKKPNSPQISLIPTSNGQLFCLNVLIWSGCCSHNVMVVEKSHHQCLNWLPINLVFTMLFCLWPSKTWKDEGSLTPFYLLSHLHHRLNVWINSHSALCSC